MKPSAGEIRSAISLPPVFVSITPALEDMLTQFSSGLSSGWAAWESGIIASSNNVSGAGIGGWAGVGSGGTIKEGSPISFVIAVRMRTSYFTTLETAIVNSIAKSFSDWAKGFTMAGVPYVGASSATPAAPGGFSATNTPMPVSGIGSGSPLTDITPMVLANLPGFNLGKSAVPDLMKALNASVQSNFTSWMSKTMLTGDTASGAASPGAGAGAGVSSGGKLV